MSRSKALAVLLALTITAAACSSGSDAATRSAAPGTVEVKADAVPGTLLGLNTTEEDVSEPFEEAKDRAYISSIRMWSLREEKRLRATIQVARFSPDASPEKESFRENVVAQVGQTAPKPRHVGGEVVYVTAANKQAIYMWFKDLHFILLSVSADYPAPRSLLRTALTEVKP